MKKKAILFLGTSMMGALYVKKAMQRLGLHPIFLLNLDDYSGDPKCAIKKCEHYEVNVYSAENILDVVEANNLMRRYEIVGITSFLDELFQVVIAIANKYRIAGPDVALNRLTDKNDVLKLIPEFSPPSFSFHYSDISTENMGAFFRSYKNEDEFILKPGISSGAVGASVVKKGVSVADIRLLIQDSGLSNADSQQWVIQPRIKGELYSLEGYVRNKNIFFLGFSQRIRNKFTEVGNEYPADLLLDQKKQCEAAVKALVDRSGFSYGYFHCEFLINGTEFFLIDPNMGRLAGAFIVQQISLAHNKTPAEIYSHVVDLGLFKGINTEVFQYEKPSKKTLGLCYGLEKPGVICKIDVPKSDDVFHTKLVDQGKKMPAIGASDCAWIGFIVGSRENVLKHVSNILITTNDGIKTPYYSLKSTIEKCEGNDG